MPLNPRTCFQKIEFQFENKRKLKTIFHRPKMCQKGDALQNNRMFAFVTQFITLFTALGNPTVTQNF